MKRTGLALALAAAGTLAMSGTALAQDDIYAGETHKFGVWCGQAGLPLSGVRSDAYTSVSWKLTQPPNSYEVTAQVTETPGTYEVQITCSRSGTSRSWVTVKPKRTPTTTPPQPQPQPNPKPQSKKPPQVKVKPVGPAQTGGGATA